MKLLDPLLRFQNLIGKKGTLYFAGACNRNWADILLEVENESFPEKIRGNFALVYIPNYSFENLFLAAVDHVASIPLFLSQESCSNHFSSIATEQSEKNIFDYDREFFWESQLFWGFTASDRTVLKSVKRIPPGSIWQKGKIRKYLNLNDHIDNKDLSKAAFSETLEQVFMRSIGSVNGLLASGGTDSATLMAVISKLKLQANFRIVSVRSNVETQNEKHLIDQLAQKLNLEINYFDAPILNIGKKRIPGKDPSEMFLWKDFSFLYRRDAVKSIDKNDLNAVLTGECGDQLFGGPKLAKHIPFLLQTKNWSSKDIARQYIHLSMRESSLEWQGYKSSPLTNWYKSIDPDKYLFEKVYDETVSLISEFFESMKTPDLLNRLLNINLIFKGPYRLFHYSQDSYPFTHPFADWDMVSLALQSRSNNKIFNSGRLKEVFYQSYQNLLINEIWEAPKVGTAIPIQRNL